MSKISEKVIKELKEKNIEPKPHWHFLLKDYSVWSAFAASVLVGALSICVILYVFMSNDWDLYKYLRVNPFEHFIFSLPYLWVLMLLAFLALSYYNYKHTKSGYRYEAYAILGMSILGSLVLGVIFNYAFGMGKRVDTALSKNLPIYSQIHAYCNRKNVWTQPEKGLLAGEVRQMFEGDGFELEDFKGLVWRVDRDEKMLAPVGFVIMAGKKIKVIGEKEEEKRFRAVEVRFWEE